MVWEEQYEQEPGRASLNYISLGVGFVIGLQISGPMIDKVRRAIRLLPVHPSSFILHSGHSSDILH
jgi:hypothetical protein